MPPCPTGNSPNVVQQGELEVDEDEVLVVVSNVGPSPIPITISSEGISPSAVQRLMSLKPSFHRQPFPADVSAEDLTTMSQEGKERLRQWLKNELEVVSGHDSKSVVPQPGSRQGIQTSPTIRQPEEDVTPGSALEQSVEGDDTFVLDCSPPPPKLMRAAAKDKQKFAPEPSRQPANPRGARSNNQLSTSPEHSRVVLNHGQKKKEEAADPDKTAGDPSPLTLLTTKPVQATRRRVATQIPCTKKRGFDRKPAPTVASPGSKPLNTQSNITVSPNSLRPDRSKASCKAQQVVDKAITLLHHLNELKKQPDSTADATTSDSNLAVKNYLYQVLQVSRSFRSLVKLLSDLQDFVYPTLQTSLDAATLQLSRGMAKRNSNPISCEVVGNEIGTPPSLQEEPAVGGTETRNHPPGDTGTPHEQLPVVVGAQVIQDDSVKAVVSDEGNDA